MLRYFPAALPDELLYSRLARYHLHSASTSPKQTLEDLFGNRSVRASIDLQCHLGALSERMPAGVREQPESLADATLFGLHTAFQPRRVWRAALLAMVDGPANGLHARLGIAAGLRLPPARLRWCLDCRDEAETRHGEPYWRRAHQIPGVLVCPDHGRALIEAQLPEARGQHEFVAASRETCVEAAGTRPSWLGDPVSRNLLCLVAREMSVLLDRPPRFADLGALTLHCRSRLIEASLAHPSGRLHLDRMSEVAKMALAPIRRIYPEASSIDWLIAMGRTHRRSFSPLRHILFDVVISAAPASLRAQSQPKRRHFLADDPDFELRLRETAYKAHGLRAAARALGVDPRTVQRHAARLGLDEPSQLNPSIPVANATATAASGREAEAKRRWLDAVDRGGNRTELRRVLPADWVWLRRHHRDWLMAHSPPRRLRSASSLREDWPRLDGELAPLIRSAAAAILGRAPPTRVTVAAIERELDRKAWFGTRLDKLTLCRAALVEVREGLDDFRTRRIVWARELILAQGRQPQQWLVRRLAGLPQSISPLIARILSGEFAP